MSKRDEYVVKMKQQLDELNAKIDVLETKREAASAELHVKFDEKMTEMRSHAKAVGVKMEEIKDAGEDKWESLVFEGERLQKALVQSFNYFKSQIRKP